MSDIRERHRQDPYSGAGCMRCGDPWPCDAIQQADLLKTAAEAFASAVDFERQKLRDMMAQRDAAKADADLLAHSLRWLLDSTSNKPDSLDRRGARAALKLHEEATK